MQLNIYTQQVNFFDNTPLTHLNHCHEGRCPSGEKVCCFECGERTCGQICDDIQCHLDKIAERLRK